MDNDRQRGDYSFDIHYHGALSRLLLMIHAMTRQRVKDLAQRSLRWTARLLYLTFTAYPLLHFLNTHRAALSNLRGHSDGSMIAVCGDNSKAHTDEPKRPIKYISPENPHAKADSGKVTSITIPQE